ncbi:MAG: hypothetical protein KF796_10640 [Ramlibacter sp.]|nr:hypothetical protein [Ramlibacter sp.]
MNPLHTALAAALIGLTTLAQAQAQPPRGGPPPEAIAACQGKAAKAACTFTGRQGEALTGVCFQPPPRREAGAGASTSAGAAPTAMPMACRPANAPAGPPQGQGGPGGQDGPPPRK